MGGKGLKEGIVEVKLRTVGKDGTEKVPVAEAGARAIALVKGLLQQAEDAADTAQA